MSVSLMITNRNVDGDQLGADYVKALRFYTSEKADLSTLDNWEELTTDQFRDLIIEVAKDFPVVDETQNEKQKHVSFFIHGYNNSWNHAVDMYQRIQKGLYTGKDGLGQLILFTWPSDGSTFNYLPDREDARLSAGDIAQVFVSLHDYLSVMQRAAAMKDDGRCCKAKISVIAHSMGNYVLQNGLAAASKRLNNPELITLIHQCAMVAADVDNDLFENSQPDASDGSLMANLCYRIGALYTGRDQVLGASAGLKHFGTRRLGRNGLADPANVWDNVFDFDVSDLIPKSDKDIHSAVFRNAKTLELLRLILIGRDRNLLGASF
jgi:esterase/lipase superfamily enzyme